MITVTVNDTLATASSSFEISVFNTPPYFMRKFQEDFTMKFNNTYNISIPEFKDDEGHDVRVLLDSIPAGKVDFAKPTGKVGFAKIIGNK